MIPNQWCAVLESSEVPCGRPVGTCASASA